MMKINNTSLNKIPALIENYIQHYIEYYCGMSIEHYMQTNFNQMLDDYFAYHCTLPNTCGCAYCTTINDCFIDNSDTSDVDYDITPTPTPPYTGEVNDGPTIDPRILLQTTPQGDLLYPYYTLTNDEHICGDCCTCTQDLPNPKWHYTHTHDDDDDNVDYDITPASDSPYTGEVNDGPTIDPRILLQTTPQGDLLYPYYTLTNNEHICGDCCTCTNIV